MEIRFTLEEAKKMFTEDFNEIIKAMQSYTNNTKNEAFAIVTSNRNTENVIIINTYIDCDDELSDCLCTYYSKNFIEDNKLNITF